MTARAGSAVPASAVPAVPVEGDGLGLSIVTGVLDLHGLELILGTSDEGGCAASDMVEGWLEGGAVKTVAVQPGGALALLHGRAAL